ncbi:MAG: hypothetical protein DDT32_00652 [Syntrophomonadaceae bacterium]|nr:hypothetical protein [Bacillota bacterium]MBT9146905.1 hypothetical protein [Bacillota bacterium]
MSQELTLQELKSYLWESANILRGSIDAADFKNYILGMLFFKRLSDVYDEEYEELLKTVGPKLASNPDMHTRFYRPEGCAWNDILSASVNIGEKVNDVFSKVTQANAHRLNGMLLGYEIFGVLENYPIGHTRYFLVKWNLPIQHQLP